MQKLIKILKIINEAKEILLALSVIAVWVLAIWFTNKLAPFVENDRQLDYRISAQETRTDSLSEDVIIIKEDVSYIRGAIDAK